MAVIKPKSISQSKLARYQELLALEAEREQLRKEIIQMALDGLPCQAGRYLCKVSTKDQRRPKWKDEAITLAKQMGYNPETWEQRILEGTPPTTSSSLLIIDRENPVDD
jgi:hypothetical protein